MKQRMIDLKRVEPISRSNMVGIFNRAGQCLWVDLDAMEIAAANYECGIHGEYNCMDSQKPFRYPERIYTDNKSGLVRFSKVDIGMVQMTRNEFYRLLKSMS